MQSTLHGALMDFRRMRRQPTDKALSRDTFMILSSFFRSFISSHISAHPLHLALTHLGFGNSNKNKMGITKNEIHYKRMLLNKK